MNDTRISSLLFTYRTVFAVTMVELQRHFFFLENMKVFWEFNSTDIAYLPKGSDWFYAALRKTHLKSWTLDLACWVFKLKAIPWRKCSSWWHCTPLQKCFKIYCIFNWNWQILSGTIFLHHNSSASSQINSTAISWEPTMCLSLRHDYQDQYFCSRVIRLIHMFLKPVASLSNPDLHEITRAFISKEIY